MPYDEVDPPTESDREGINTLFERIIKRCYPNCRYVNDKTGEVDKLVVKFFSEITMKTEDGEEDKKDRVAAIFGGLDTDEETLHLLIDLGKWRASTFERNLAILTHEVTHVENPEHTWKFWLDFIENYNSVEESLNDISQSERKVDVEKLRKEVVHHVTGYTVSSNENWWTVRRDLADIIGYPTELYKAFELWAEPVHDESLITEERKNAGLSEDIAIEDTYIRTMPIRNGQISNMILSPKYVEEPAVSEDEVSFHIINMVEEGFPLLPPPVVKPDSSGAYRVVEGEVPVAIAQEIGLLDIEVINTSRKISSIHEFTDEFQAEDVAESIDEIRE